MREEERELIVALKASTIVTLISILVTLTQIVMMVSPNT